MEMDTWSVLKTVMTDQMIHKDAIVIVLLIKQGIHVLIIQELCPLVWQFVEIFIESPLNYVMMGTSLTVKAVSQIVRELWLNFNVREVLLLQMTFALLFVETDLLLILRVVTME